MSMQRLMEENATLGDDESDGFNWQKLIGQGFDFGKTFLNDKYAKDAAKFAAPTTAISTAQPTAAASTTAGGALTASAGGSGFQLGQTFIPWSYLFIGGGLLFLLQSSGFQRRGR